MTSNDFPSGFRSKSDISSSEHLRSIFAVRDKKSAGQLAQRDKLKECLRLYGLLDGVFLYSWQTKAKDMVMNGCNLFIKENIRHFNAEGETSDWANLKICAGSYPFPPDLSVEQESSGTLTLRWNPDDATAQTLDDLLLIGAYGFISC